MRASPISAAANHQPARAEERQRRQRTRRENGSANELNIGIHSIPLLSFHLFILPTRPNWRATPTEPRRSKAAQSIRRQLSRLPSFRFHFHFHFLPSKPRRSQRPCAGKQNIGIAAKLGPPSTEASGTHAGAEFAQARQASGHILIQRIQFKSLRYVLRASQWRRPPARQPASQPASQPTNQPTSQPANQPASQWRRRFQLAGQGRRLSVPNELAGLVSGCARFGPSLVSICRPSCRCAAAAAAKLDGPSTVLSCLLQASRLTI